MDRWTRILLVALAVAYLPGTPGLGVDTRDQAAVPAFIGYVYGVAFFAPIVAFAASWKWPGPARWLALLSAIAAIVLPGLDLAGVVAGPPPAGMIVLNAILIVLGVAILLRQRNAKADVAAQGGRPS